MWLFEDKILEYVEQTQLKLSLFAAKYAFVKSNHTLIEQIVNVWVRPTTRTAAALELDLAAGSLSVSEPAPALPSAADNSEGVAQMGQNSGDADSGALEGEHKSLEYLLQLVDFSVLFALNDTFRMRDLSEKLRFACPSSSYRLLLKCTRILDYTCRRVVVCCRAISNQYEGKVSVSSRKIHELIQKSFEVRCSLPCVQTRWHS